MSSTRLISALIATCAAVAVPASAVDWPWNHYSFEVPVALGDYIAVPGGDSTTLGSMTLSVTPDSRRVLGGAIYHYGEDGRMIVQALNGTLDYSDDTTLRETGVIAQGPLTAYDLAGGTCRGCPPRERATTPTGETVDWKWTGPRAGILTIDGVRQKMVHAYSGPPLVAPVDFSGSYLLVFRQSTGNGVEPAQSEAVHAVRLTAVNESRVYEQGIDLLGDWSAWGSVALPPAGARLFDIACETVRCPLWVIASSGWRPNWYGDYGTDPNEYTLWFDEAGNGRLLGVKREGPRRIVMDHGVEYPRVYGCAEKVISRRAKPNSGSTLETLSEFALLRIGENTLNTRDWKQPSCFENRDPGNCSPLN